MKYRRVANDHDYLPAEVEAFQWWPSMGSVGGVHHDQAHDIAGRVEVDTFVTEVDAGNWVLKDGATTLVMTETNFRASYEPIEESTSV